MIIQGNYWSRLIGKEKKFRKEVERVMDRMLGHSFSDYQDMASQVRMAIRNHLEHYGVSQQMGMFNVEYDLDLKYNPQYKLTDYKIKFLFLEEEDHW